MCTAGFWTDETGIRHYFKNRMLSKTPQHQVVDFSKEGIFIKDEHGRFEGMNKYGLYAVSLSMEPRVKRKKPRREDINKDILLNFKSVVKAVEFFKEESEKYDMGFNELIGNNDKTFYIEVTPNEIVFSDLGKTSNFACTNHSLLLTNQGNWQDTNNSSHKRLQSARNQLLQVKKYDDLKHLLSSHDNGKEGFSICSHDRTQSHTVGAYVFTPSEKRGEICLNGFPCEKDFQIFDLRNKREQKFGIYK